MPDPRVTFRPIAPDDMDFLLRVYGSTREEEMAMVVDWTAEQKDAFVRSQFEAQHGWYQDHYRGRSSTSSWSTAFRPAGSTSIGGSARSGWSTSPSSPSSARGGIGTSLLRDLLAEGEAAGKPVTIHVEVFNPAMRLYERLGFLPIEERGPYRLMEWKPSAP